MSSFKRLVRPRRLVLTNEAHVVLGTDATATERKQAQVHLFYLNDHLLFCC